MSKKRRHHNNDGRRQIQRGKTRRQMQRLAKRLGVPYDPKGAKIKDLGSK